jgi:polar amino acid transport system substrate-binding protein
MLKTLFFLITFIPWCTKADNIRVVTEHLPPYQVAENGQVNAGYSYLIMEEVFKRAKIQANTEVMPWARAYNIALNETNTIIYSMARSVERESLFKWIGQLHHMQYSFFSIKSNDKINIETLMDSLNYTAVSVNGSFEANTLLRLGFELGVNLILVVDYSTAWKMLQMGRADITYGNAPIFLGNKVDDTLFKRRGPVVETRDLYVAANVKTNEKVINNLSTIFQSVKNDPLFNALFKTNRHQ